MRKGIRSGPGGNVNNADMGRRNAAEQSSGRFARDILRSRRRTSPVVAVLPQRMPRKCHKQCRCIKICYGSQARLRRC
ncbi:hypothetical protein VTJ04DRAFT_4267 [Mycothermus thermophilus]|uniref:uncharacterized protein n=1 Tax=Humicola insolens TaxID=85995 RepID=UPI0037448154